MSNQRNAKYQLAGPYQQTGFTLGEILIGMTLGIFLMTGIIQLFIGNKQTYAVNGALSEIQENGHFAMELLSKSIRMANFTGCALTGNTVENKLGGSAWWQNFNTNWSGVLVGYDGSVAFSGAAFGTSVGNRISGTDAIVALGGSGGYSILTNNASSTPPAFQLKQISRPNGRYLGLGDPLIVCNATNTVVFQVTNHPANTSPSSIEHVAGNFSIYDSQSTMADYVPTAFYIGVGSAGSDSKSLYQLQLQIDYSTGAASLVPQEMVEGVRDMQIYYGEDTNIPIDGVANIYRDATDVTNWANVVNVRIYLLLASLENNITKQAQTYIFPVNIGDSAKTGRLVTASDLRLYQVFSTTIGIRNRLP